MSDEKLFQPEDSLKDLIDNDILSAHKSHLKLESFKFGKFDTSNQPVSSWIPKNSSSNKFVIADDADFESKYDEPSLASSRVTSLNNQANSRHKQAADSNQRGSH